MINLFKVCSLAILILCFSRCHVNKSIIQKIDWSKNSREMKVFIHFNGGLVPDTDIDVNLVAIKRSDTSTKIDTLYNFVYKKYVFTVERDYLRFENSEKHIRYDNRIIGNANRKELPNKSYSFIKKYFILDTGEDDIYLIPIIKNRY